MGKIFNVRIKYHAYAPLAIQKLQNKRAHFKCWKIRCGSHFTFIQADTHKHNKRIIHSNINNTLPESQNWRGY